MQNDAGLHLELTTKDVDAYWKGRVFIEAARMAHDAHEDKQANTLTYQAIESYLEQGRAVIDPIREQHEGDLPDAVFEEGETLEPRFVVMLALMLESENQQIGGKTIKSMAYLSSATRDKKIVLVLNKHNTALSRHLALESGFEVRESGLIEVAEAIRDKMTGFFELDTPRIEKEPDHNLRAVRQKHNRVGRHSGNQRFNAKPARQNFKGRGR
ncbi:hypothetical protein HOT49_gp067 [Erwinia phage vB_EamM_Alexandra]|uniref:Uncharacterized protein n=1 Tax=Erwinia phage vB_EamM_Alexandra TaxID=2201424 RepID=A0A2Z4QE01_9CAUD|nr:hypothetical protein HOT49_gp067 [Erwinia phage vB_EamM_Alexandra]AWY08347.1 hypothetical protein Alexandra_67 [Erwinia phage vB_EamM_Alexandra]